MRRPLVGALEGAVVVVVSFDDAEALGAADVAGSAADVTGATVAVGTAAVVGAVVGAEVVGASGAFEVALGSHSANARPANKTILFTCALQSRTDDKP